MLQFLPLSSIYRQRTIRVLTKWYQSDRFSDQIFSPRRLLLLRCNSQQFTISFHGDRALSLLLLQLPTRRHLPPPFPLRFPLPNPLPNRPKLAISCPHSNPWRPPQRLFPLLLQCPTRFPIRSHLPLPAFRRHLPQRRYLPLPAPCLRVHARYWLLPRSSVRPLHPSLRCHILLPNERGNPNPNQR